MSFIEWMSVLSNIASIIGLCLTLKSIKMKAIIENSYSKVFGLSLIFSAIVFLVPWNKIHFGDTTPKVVYVDSSKIKLIPKEKTTPVVSKKETIYIKQDLPKYLKSRNKTHRDTTNKSSISGNNGILSTGSNAHNVAGSNNNVAINGDVFVNAGFELTDEIKSNILRVILNNKKIFSITSDCLTINNTQFYNGGGKFLNQLESFLISKGYTITSHALIPGNFGGLMCTSSDNCLDLNLGYF